MTSSRAAVVETGGAPFTLSDVELDELRANEVLIRMTAAGLCHTDPGVASGGLPFPLPGVLGHEGAGVVEQTGSAVTAVRPGDHAILSFTSCGTCANCRGGHPAYCATWLPANLIGGTRADGSTTVRRGELLCLQMEASGEHGVHDDLLSVRGTGGSSRRGAEWNADYSRLSRLAEAPGMPHRIFQFCVAARSCTPILVEPA